MNEKMPASPDAGRRKFLAQCGKFAILTPPAITMLLSMTEQSFAHAASGGGGYGGGKGGSGGGGYSGGGWSGSHKPPVTGGSGKGGYKPGDYSHLDGDKKKKLVAAGHDLLADLLGKLAKH